MIHLSMGALLLWRVTHPDNGSSSWFRLGGGSAPGVVVRADLKAFDSELVPYTFLCMASRWKWDKPMSRSGFDTRFSDDAACARHMAEQRWSDGFRCPACGGGGWELQAKRYTWKCIGRPR